MKQHWVIEALEQAARQQVRAEQAAGNAVMVFGLTVQQIRLLRDFYEARAGKPAGTIEPEEVALAEAAADYFYDAEDWEFTAPEPQLVLDNLDASPHGILELGRLAKLPSKFVVRVYDEAEDKYGYRCFDSYDEAFAAQKISRGEESC